MKFSTFISKVSFAMLLASSGTCAIAADVSPQQLSKDLAAADAQCSTAVRLTLSTMCFNSVDHPVWMQEAPSTIDIYEKWNATRLDAASKYDSGVLSIDGLKAAIKAGQTELWTQVVARNQYAAQQAHPVQQPQVVQQPQNDNTALLLGLGAAFLNGYNSARPAPSPPFMTTCTRNGAMTNCLSN